jgi:hypothetical protein
MKKALFLFLFVFVCCTVKTNAQAIVSGSLVGVWKLLSAKYGTGLMANSSLTIRETWVKAGRNDGVFPSSLFLEPTIEKNIK